MNAARDIVAVGFVHRLACVILQSKQLLTHSPWTPSSLGVPPGNGVKQDHANIGSHVASPGRGRGCLLYVCRCGKIGGTGNLFGSEQCLDVIAGCACSIHPKLARRDSIHNLQGEIIRPAGHVDKGSLAKSINRPCWHPGCIGKES